MFGFNIKKGIDKLLLVAIGGLVLTTIYTLYITVQGAKTKKMIKYIYKQTKERERR